MNQLPVEENYEDTRTLSYFNKLSSVSEKPSGESCSLIIIDRERAIKTVALKGNDVTIGQNGDIKIVSNIVSRIHGRFTCVNGEYYYNDEGSLNGSELNGVRISVQPKVASGRFVLGNGDVIRIMVPGDLRNPENTLIVFSRQPAEGLRWQYIDLRARTAPLEIGRRVGNDGLKVDSMQASKLHAMIFPSTYGYVLRDCRSLNGVAVNGHKISEDTLLQDFDVIGIAGTRIIYLGGFIFFNAAPNGVKLEVRDISKVVSGSKRPILDHVSLTVNPCELVAVIGTSGAGKTTFVNCINGYEPATSGQVLFDGLELRQHYGVLKNRIGNVPQKDELYDYLTVYRFIMFAARLRLSTDIGREERRERVQKVIDIMGLTEHQNKLIKKLSGGQKKRVSIAMELVSDPDIFFLDEPTSGLDPETETSLMKQLKNLSQNIGKTILVITHTLQNIHLFDKIIFLAPGGRLCFYGSPAEALDFFGIKAIPEAYEKVKNNANYFVDKYQQQLSGGNSNGQ